MFFKSLLCPRFCRILVWCLVLFVLLFFCRGWSLDAHPHLSCLTPGRTGAPELPRLQCPPFNEVTLTRPALVTEGSGRPPRRVTPGGISVHFCLNACSEVKDKRRVCLLVLCILMCILLGHRYMCKCVCVCVGVCMCDYKSEMTRAELRPSS